MCSSSVAFPRKQPRGGFCSCLLILEQQRQPRQYSRSLSTHRTPLSLSLSFSLSRACVAFCARVCFRELMSRSSICCGEKKSRRGSLFMRKKIRRILLNKSAVVVVVVVVVIIIVITCDDDDACALVRLRGFVSSFLSVSVLGGCLYIKTPSLA